MTENTPRILEFDLAEWYPKQIIRHSILPGLKEGIALVEKDFRSFVKGLDLQDEDTVLHWFHSEDQEVILPAWVAPYLANQCNKGYSAYSSSQETLLVLYYAHVFRSFDFSLYSGKRVLIRGCSDKPIPPQVYTMVASTIGRVAKKLSYGELCSQVPL